MEDRLKNPNVGPIEVPKEEHGEKRVERILILVPAKMAS